MAHTVRSYAALLALFFAAACGVSNPPPADPDGGPAPDGGRDGGNTCVENADCDDDLFCNGEEVCDPGAPGADAEGCRPAASPCMASQMCDEAADACRTECDVEADADGDGVRAIACGGQDCDDTDRDRFPGNTEICDLAGHDEDCDETTFGERDADRDGHFDALCCNHGTADHCGDDCDDARTDVYGGLLETCDDRDNDCDGTTDEGVVQTVYRDRDGDLHGDPTTSTTCDCVIPGGYVLNQTDCDDSRGDRNPTTAETCDLVDNDCDDTVDEMIGTVYWPDADGDGYGDAEGTTTRACAQPTGYAANSTDCDDGRRLVNPATTELCDGLDNNCDGRIDESGPRTFYRDADGDGAGDPGSTTMITACEPPSGFVASPDDCDDGSSAIHPGASELCDGLDNDCSLGLAGDGRDSSEDGDGDHHAPIGHACSGGSFPEDDCNDSNAATYPGAPELCDGLDDDCSSGGGTLASEDADGDAHSPPGAACSGGSYPKNDCVDTNATIHGGALELCDRLDNDCSSGGGVELAEDRDGDGHAPVTSLCAGGPLPEDDCLDTNANSYPGAPELCDRLDNDCSSGGGAVAAEDADNDGHTAVGFAGCSGGFSRDDCVDSNNAIYSGAPELCDRLDNDCSTGGGTLTTEDADNDGHTAVGFAGCSGGSFSKDDCVDSNAAIYSGAPELCDRLDNDCSSGGGTLTSEDADDDGHTAVGFAGCSGGAFSKDDCVDNNASIYPGAPELCDRLDNDCSSGGGTLTSEDADNDGHTAVGFAGCSGGTFSRDDCADDNASIYPGAPELAPAPLSPENGALTGSVHAPAARMTRRPLFRWNPATGAGTCGARTYEIEIDDSCSISGYTSCAFPSPEVRATSASASYRPAADLSVSTAVPVGRRYFWRVRTCNTGGCSAWGTVRYVDVGRARSDFDGDGWSDVVVGAVRQDNGAADEGNAFIYDGGPGGIGSTPSVTLDAPGNEANGRFGCSVASVGDLNGDGYGDLAVGAESQGSPNRFGRVYLYYGGESGITTSTRTLNNPVNQNGARFGHAVAGAGDVDADGYADLIVGAYLQAAPVTNEGNAFIYLGRSDGVGTSPARTLDSPANVAMLFGRTVASAGDLNGDGYADIVIGALYSNPANSEGGAFIYYGSAAGIPTTASLPLDNPTNQESGSFGQALAAGDLNGDGYSDLVAGATGQTAGADGEGNVFVFHGRDGGPLTTPSVTIDNPANDAWSSFGSAVAVADVNDDGFVDLVAGAPLYESGVGTAPGMAWVFHGSADSVSLTPTLPVPNPTGRSSTQFGEVISSAGDVDANGYADFVFGAPGEQNGASGEGAVYTFHGASGGISATPARTLDNPTNEASAQFGYSVN